MTTSPSILIKTNGKSPNKLDPASPAFLSDLVSPFSLEEFRRGVLEARDNVAYASIGGGNAKRVDRLLEEYFCNGNVEDLVNNTSSPNGEVSVWLNPVSQQSSSSSAPRGLTSVKMSDLRAIMNLHNCAGSSLYFRAPEEANEALTRAVTSQLGRLFCEDPADGMSRSEVEVFVANRRDALTTRHTDFQDNFTIQLRGKKTWRISKRRSIRHPLRGITPHFADVPLETIEKQILGVRACGAETIEEEVGQFHVPPSLDEEFDTVTLGPGDFLYHPSGIWHQVCTVEAPSLSINISLVNPRWCDLVSDNLRQYLYRFPIFRSSVDKEGLKRMLALSSSEASNSPADDERDGEVRAILRKLPFRVGDMIPSFLLEEGGEEDEVKSCRTYDLTSVNNDETPISRGELRYARNPLASIVFDDDLGEEDEEHESHEGQTNKVNKRKAGKKEPLLSFVVHTNFGDASGDLISLTRCELTFPARFRGLLRRLAVYDSFRDGGDEVTREIERLCRDITPKIARHEPYVNALVGCGLLTIVSSSPDSQEKPVGKRRRVE